MGISRSAENPTTYFGVTAASSITKPTDLDVALREAVAISSSEAAAVLAINDTSFSKAKSPVDICVPPLGDPF